MLNGRNKQAYAQGFYCGEITIRIQITLDAYACNSQCRSVLIDGNLGVVFVIVYLKFLG